MDNSEEQVNEEEVIKSLKHLDAIYRTQEKFEEAENVLIKLFLLQKKLFGGLTPETADSLFNLAQVYRQQGRLEKADTFMEKAIEIKASEVGEDSPEIQDNGINFMLRLTKSLRILIKRSCYGSNLKHCMKNLLERITQT